MKNAEVKILRKVVANHNREAGSQCDYRIIVKKDKNSPNSYNADLYYQNSLKKPEDYMPGIRILLFNLSEATGNMKFAIKCRWYIALRSVRGVDIPCIIFP